MNTKHLPAFALFALASAVHAQMADMPMPAAPKSAASAPSRLTEGEALKVDQAAGKVLLRHGPIENLGMPAMTMKFPVSDPKLLAGIKDGDRVRFHAERVNGATVVTGIEPAK